jgi:hypothetical protein
MSFKGICPFLCYKPTINGQMSILMVNFPYIQRLKNFQDIFYPNYGHLSMQEFPKQQP